MKNTLKLLSVGLLLGVGTAVWADFDYDVSNIALLQSKDVQAELGITEAQRGMMNRDADWFNTANKKIATEAQEYQKKGEQPPQSLIQKSQNLAEGMKKRIMGLLSTGQRKRLRELTLQGAGYLALMDPTIAKKVGLTTAQSSTIRTQFETAGKKAQQAQADAFKPIMERYKAMDPKTDDDKKKVQAAFEKDMKEAQDKLAPSLKKYQDDWVAFVKKSLTAAQTKALDDLKGKPFKAKS